MQNFRMWVHEKDHAAMERLAKRDGESVAEMYRRAASEYIEKNKPAPRAKETPR